MIKIEFPADRTDIASAIGRALLEVSGQSPAVVPVKGPNSPDVVGGKADATPPDGDGDTTAIGEREGSVFQQQPEGNDNLPQVDPNGVAFSAAMCGVSADPFYATGKRKGQWKKRRGVDEAAYDAWYAEQCEPQAGGAATPETTGTNTAAAFNKQTGEVPDDAVPQDCGQFMTWSSAQQVAGHLTQEAIAAAYETAGLVITDLFPPNDPATIAERVATLHGLLSNKAPY